MSLSRIFVPDLIVEATSVCDRQCVGCYAPNLLATESPENLQARSPEMFLEIDQLRSLLVSLYIRLGREVPVLAIRGGEPSLHPDLISIVETCTLFASQVVVETHGRWILDKPFFASQLLATLARTSATVKISFDKMHALSSQKLLKIVDRLTEEKVNYLVAITAPTEKDFLAAQLECPFIADDKFLFQKLASTAADLIRPSLGVVHANGVHTGQLRMKDSFSNATSRVSRGAM